MSAGQTPVGGTRTSLDARRLADLELSTPSRMTHVALLLAGASMSGLVGSLWVTEPFLPGRTRAAFAALTIVGLSWTAFAAWVLVRRRVLFGRQRVVAGRMAVTFAAAYLAAALAVGYVKGGPTALAAIGTGGVLLAVAIAVFVRARRAVARLVARREELEQTLGGRA